MVTVINYLQEFVGDGYKGQLSTPMDRVEVFTYIHNIITVTNNTVAYITQTLHYVKVYSGRGQWNQDTIEQIKVS